MKRILVALCTVFLLGCETTPAPPMALPALNQTVATPPPDKAQIIFIQPFKPVFGEAHLTGLYEVKGEKKEMLGVLASQGRLVKLVEPGQHLFMTHGFGASLLRANVEAGKRYYVFSRFVAYVGYQLRPIRKTGPSDYNATIPEFRQWAALPLMELTTEGTGLYSRHLMAGVDKSYTYAWESWQRKTDAERAELTLNPDDNLLQ